MHRQDHYPHLGLALAHPGRRLEPGNPFHGDVHQDDIRALALRELERLFAACRFAYHLDVVHRAQKRADARAHQRVVIGEYDTDGRRRHQAACGFSPGSSGNDASNTVPCPGAERSSKEPPASATRSSMPASPRLAPAAARRRAAATSKPPPSSRTESSSRAPLANRRSHKLRARACRTTLLIASCAMRKQAVSTCAGISRGVSGASKCGARLASAAWRSRCERSAAPRPRSSSCGGRRLSESWRTRSSVWLTVSTHSSTRARDSSWIFSAVSAWPTSSCRSRARRRRSCSCTSSSRREWLYRRIAVSFAARKRRVSASNTHIGSGLLSNSMR